MRRNALILAMTLASVLALTTLTGCSREKIDWKSAESADTVESYDHFVERHPDSALATQARTRITQLNEDRDWKKATGTDTADAYRQFLAQHESGKWAEEARIRIENFSLDGTATGPSKPVAESPVAQPAVAATPLPAHGPKEAQLPPAASSPPTGAPAKPATIAKPAMAPTAAPEAKRVAGATTPTPAPETKRVAVASAATAPVKPTAAAAAPAPTAQFGVQLGAFHSQDAALKNWKQLQSKYDSDLHGLFAHAVPVKQTSGQLFRLQAPVGEESRARSICASLSKHAQPCVVVLPQP